MPGVAGDLVGVDLIIRQPDVQLRQPVLLGIDGPVDHPLRPVAGVHVLLHLLGGDGRGLDLVDDDGPGLVGEDAVGPALQSERNAVHFPLRCEEDFGGVALARSFLQPAVDACPLVGAVEAGEAAVDAAGAEQKFHQLPDGEMDSRHRGHLTFHGLALSVSAGATTTFHSKCVFLSLWSAAPPLQNPPRRGSKSPAHRGSSWLGP